MKQIKKAVLSLILALALVIPVSIPLTGSPIVAQASSMKLNIKSLQLTVGKSKSLKVIGTKKKVTWKSSNKLIVSVNSSGKVTANKIGQATITAVTSGKKFTCKVNVVDTYKDNNGNVYNTTMEGIAELNIDVPSGWRYDVEPMMIDPSVAENFENWKLVPPDMEYGNEITIQSEKIGKKAPEYNTVKESLAAAYTKEELEFNDSIKVSDIKTSDVTTKQGTAFRAEYSLTVDDITYYYVVYEFYINNYRIKISVCETQKIGLESIAVNLINSIREK